MQEMNAMLDSADINNGYLVWIWAKRNIANVSSIEYGARHKTYSSLWLFPAEAFCKMMRTRTVVIDVIMLCLSISLLYCGFGCVYVCLMFILVRWCICDELDKLTKRKFSQHTLWLLEMSMLFIRNGMK